MCKFDININIDINIDSRENDGMMDHRVSWHEGHTTYMPTGVSVALVDD